MSIERQLAWRCPVTGGRGLLSPGTHEKNLDRFQVVEEGANVGSAGTFGLEMHMFRSHQVNRSSPSILGVFEPSKEGWKIKDFTFDIQNGFHREGVERRWFSPHRKIVSVWVGVTFSGEAVHVADSSVLRSRVSSGSPTRAMGGSQTAGAKTPVSEISEPRRPSSDWPIGFTRSSLGPLDDSDRFQVVEERANVGSAGTFGLERHMFRSHQVNRPSPGISWLFPRLTKGWKINVFNFDAKCGIDP